MEHGREDVHRAFQQSDEVSETNTTKRMRTDKQLSRKGNIVKSHSNPFAMKDERV